MTGETTIVGAGPAGLACAIALARAGRSVVVREWHDRVGARFHNDYQGLENWSRDEDVLHELKQAGIDTDFEKVAVSAGTAFDAKGRRYGLRSEQPLYYLVRRGSGQGTLDRALLEQAIALGVEVRFDDRVREAREADILATGPRTADAIAAGYVFETDMAEGSWLALDDDLAPSGYAYLLVYGGRGTVASCMFRGFREEAQHVARTVKFFRDRAGLVMSNPKTFGGYGNFRFPYTAQQGGRPVIGEQGGFQDPLAGFGMLYALRSGILAAQSVITGALWQQSLGPLMKAGAVNRYLFNLGGDALRCLALSRLEHRDARIGLQRAYRPSLISALLFPFIKTRIGVSLEDPSCSHENCDCVWCRSVAQGNAPTCC